MKKNCTLITFLFLLFGGMLTAQTVEFADDFESGLDGWTLEGTWGLSTAQFNNGANSLTDSPGGDYLASQEVSATLANGLDLTSALDANLSFWAIYDIEGGNFDFCYVEASADGGATWVIIGTFLGENNLSPWVKYDYSLGGFVGNADVKIRFRLSSDVGLHLDGIYIDDLEITSSEVDNGAPLIVHTPSEFYEGEEGAVTRVAEIIDISGVESATLTYSVEGGADQTVNGIGGADNLWIFVIPEQGIADLVTYTISAVDASVNSNSSMSDEYSYLSGRHDFYDNGVVSFVNSFGPLSMGGLASAAVRHTLDGRRLAYALIRNYTDTNRPNDDIEFHIWADEGGLPGADLIEPITVTPEANLDESSIMTRVDLRDIEALWDVTGDVFVGYTCTAGQAWLVQTTPAVAERSYSQTTATGLWAIEGDDYHFRIITGPAQASNVDDLVFDQSIDLFPNPTNGNTYLRFDLEDRAEVQITITDALGRLIDVSQENVFYDTIEIPTEQLSAGLYFVNISNGSSISTKKLVKN